MGWKILNRTFLAAAALVSAIPTAQALDLNAGFNFDGVLVDDSTGSPHTSPVAVRFQVLSPNDCVLFEESHSQVTLSSDGSFSVRVGSGTRAAASVDGGLLLRHIFANPSTQLRSSASSCTNGYTPANGDGRKLRVFIDGTPLSPDFPIAPAPMATVAESVQGLTPTDLVVAKGNSSIDGNLDLINSSPLRFRNSTTNFVAVRAPHSLQSSVTLTLPDSGGANGQVLSTDGNGVLSWINLPTAGGSSQWEPSTIDESEISGLITEVSTASPLLGGGTDGALTLIIDTGTGANQIVQLDGSARIPAVDGGLLTNVNAMKLAGKPVASAGTPAHGSVLMWNGTFWEPVVVNGGGSGGGSSSWTSDGSNLFFNGGRVGIGTNNPQAQLEIFGLGPSSALIIPRDTTINRPMNVTNGMIRYNTDTNKFEAYEAGLWRNMISSSGPLTSLKSQITYISNTDAGKIFNLDYDFGSYGQQATIYLPNLATVPDGFSVTITRQVPRPLRIQPYPASPDRFSANVPEIEMKSRNLQSVTITRLGLYWKLVNQTEECVIGQECWTPVSTSGIKQIYVGTYKGYQYFTTPGGCTDYPPTTCSGGTDSVKKVWASGETMGGNSAGGSAPALGTPTESSYTDAAVPCSICGTMGMAEYLGTFFANTAAAKYCANMTYAGYADWYLPSQEELAFLRRNSATIGGFQYSTHYWSSTESDGGSAVAVSASGVAHDVYKSEEMFVRCVRRW